MQGEKNPPGPKEAERVRIRTYRAGGITEERHGLPEMESPPRRKAGRGPG